MTGSAPDVSALVDDLDPENPDLIANPYPRLAALREATPIATDSDGVRLVTRYSDVRRLLEDRRLGRVFEHRYSPAEFGQTEPERRWTRFDEHEQWSLLSLEPPDHTRLRRLIAKAFGPTSIANVSGDVRDLAEDVVAGAADRDRFDLIADIAQPYSVAVICGVLGVPTADTQLLLDWSHAIVKMYEPHTTDDQKQTAETSAGAFIDYTRELIAAKRRTPDDGLVARLVAVEDDGETLSDPEIISTTMVLLEAGHEATVNSLGNGLRGAMIHREEWVRLVDGDVSVRTATEEMIRWDAPLHRFDRWVLDDGVEVGDVDLPVGTAVGLLFGSANRDPRRFDEPERFDLGRDDATHIGFGAGVHLCVGRHLARLELDVMVETLARRLPDLTMVEEPAYHPTFVIRGLEELILSPRCSD